MNKKTIILALVGFLFLLVGVGAGVYYIREQQLIEKKAFVQGGVATLTLSPDAVSLAPGESTTISLILSAETNQNLVNLQAQISWPTSAGLTPNGPFEANSVLRAPNDLWAFSTPQPETVGDQYVLKLIGTYNSSDSYILASSTTLGSFTITADAAASGTVTLALDQANGFVNILAQGGSNFDILGTVKDATVTIGSGTEPTNTPTPTEPAGTEPTNTPTPTEPAGTEPSLTPTPTTGSSGTGGTTPTNTPAPTSSSSGSSTSVRLTSVSAGATLTDTTPTFSGTGAPNANITIEVHSSAAITGSTVANSSGSWSWTPTTPLTDGAHTVTVTAVDSFGNVTTSTTNFIIASSGLISSGVSLPTLITLAAGIIILATGFGLIWL